MSKWIEEEIEPGLRAQYGLNEILHTGRSRFQTVDLVDLQAFGRSLMIDGLIQSTQCDEFVYHECLVHPALLSHPNPTSVYIGGGGEGSTAREVLRHKSVTRCVMVDIDETVVGFCREHLPENTQAFADPRLELIIDDAKAVLTKQEGGFDVIIMDLDDPLDGGPCYQLYTAEFYQTIRAKLNPGGIFVTQSGAAGIKQHPLVWSPVHNTLRSVFSHVVPYNQAVFSFLDEWGWNMASDADQLSPMPPEKVDELIASRITGDLKFLDGQSYVGIFSLSKIHRQTLANETKVLSTHQKSFSFMHNQGLCVAEGQTQLDDAPAPQP